MASILKSKGTVWLNGSGNEILLSVVYKNHILKLGTFLEGKFGQKYSKQVEDDILISDKLDFKIELIRQNIEEYFLIKRKMKLSDIIILNIN